ncbi:hypothetical protein [Pontibacter sp. G13]|uniref:hypothetical protein n=1 Tax=Pontibacter sp. G13 TaxID=3074898 RepID=UPI00288A7B66|nr:hypothetical protein [Pontibacter sp. G13]WNJ20194.1 hypothetical protein RJD25_06915 [Pontibacter sp. G13]
MNHTTSFIGRIMTIILVFCTTSTWAQDNFLPGFYITQTNDTIRGLIHYQSWVNSPSGIEFKLESNQAIETLSPLTTREVHVKGEIWIGGTIQVETSPRAIRNLIQSPSLELSPDTAFLLVLVNGRKTLAYHRNVSKNENFYILNQGKLELLEYKKYLGPVNPEQTSPQQEIASEQLYEKEIQRYKGQLLEYLSDWYTGKEEIKSTPYSRRSLVALFKSYYRATTQMDFDIQEMAKFNHKFGVIAGVTYYQLDMFRSSGADPNLSLHPRLTKSQFTHHVGFSGGVTAEFILPRNVRHNSIYTELAYHGFTSSSYYESSNSSGEYRTEYDSQLEFHYLKLLGQYRLRQSLGKLSLYEGIGVLVNTPIIRHHETIERDVTPINTSERSYDTFKSLKPFEVGLGASLGIGGDHLSGEIRYEMGNGLSSQPGLGSLSHRASLMIGYNL